ncbi:MAG TPA: polysaccharide biosynthesis protein, partial [Bacteroidales bacterium]|nr:polysaccharide biosynthesis protein [Bacteroidales bacterium]HRT84595.1 polysaccharide biosynthesis protein [Bacteroidales bacterium]
MEVNTGRSDLLWNYAASFMRLASALIILPLILHLLPVEEVGLWNIMISLNAMIYLLDFGF